MSDQIRIIDTPDSHGGIIREITAQVEKLQEKQVIPTESNQTVAPSSGYTGLSSVQVDGIPSNYVGSTVPRKDSSDVTIEGNMVNIPSGYYSESTAKDVSSGFTPIPIIIPMRVQVSNVRMCMHVALKYDAIAGEMYEGETVVEPILYNSVILETRGKVMPDDVTVNPIRILDVDNPAGGYTVTIGQI